jgi:predicted alpha-1,6-mannanase (GH76 family)
MVPPHPRTSAIVLFFLLLTMIAAGFGRVPDHAAGSSSRLPAARQQAATAMDQLDSDFLDPRTGLFDVTGGDAEPASAVWPLSQALTAAVAVARLTGSPADLARVQRMIQALGPYASPAGGYRARIVPSERFYDDNNWIALALLDAYDLLHQPALLSRVEDIYAFTATGWDPSGGGMRWSDHQWDRPTAATAPAITVGVRLAMLTHNGAYLAFAKRLYNWENANLRDPSGMYWDHLLAAGGVDRDIVSYNQADMIEANLAYLKLTGQRYYLKQAVAIATLTASVLRAPWHSRGMFADFDGLYMQALGDLHAIVPAVSMQVAQEYAAWSWSLASTPRVYAAQRTQDGLLEQAGYILAEAAVAAT